jgi:diaminohydroxyphosphoribosylaminopyrimidine deaminase/5-amino-6-(5-phosphoribosylamino)uracil reductase
MAEADRALMMRALRLARRGAGLTSPNPMVGAIIVKDGRIVGEGYYLYDRLKHAEICALEMAGPLAQKATLYCTLEPCSHYGRTPPCADRLIEAGIARAFIAIKDPDARVNGRGLNQLRAAGIEVNIGLCEDEAIRLNEIYLKYATTGMPFIHALTGKSQQGSANAWTASRQLCELASQYDAILLGSCSEVNQVVIEACLSRNRHRPLAVIATFDDIEQLNQLIARVSDAQKGAEGARIEIISIKQRRLSSDLLAAIKKRAGLPITSILILPGVLSAAVCDTHSVCDTYNDSHWPVDKVTLIGDEQ